MNNWPPAPWIFCRLVLIHQFFTPPGVQICTFPISEWELNHSGAFVKTHTKLILVGVPLVFPAFAPCMNTFPCFAEHHCTGSDPHLPFPQNNWMSFYNIFISSFKWTFKNLFSSICIITFENMPCPIGWLFQSCLSTRQSFNPVMAFRYANVICFAKRYLN